MTRSHADWRTRSAVPSRPVAASVSALIANVAERLRTDCRPMPGVAVDAVAEDVVLEVARFVLGWVESSAEPASDTNAPRSQRTSLT